MYCPYSKKIGARVVGRLFAYLLLPMMVSVSTFPVAEADAAQNGQNAIVAIEVQNQPAATTVMMTTREPVGYRYTVYDSFDPVRVVVDFPGMDVSDVAKVIPVKDGPVQEVRVSSFDLTSGKLGRVELLLTTTAKYEVELKGKVFQVRFDKDTGQAGAVSPVSGTAPSQAEAVAQASSAAETPPEPASASPAVASQAADQTAAATKVAAAPAPGPSEEMAAQWIRSLQVGADKAVIHHDGKVGKYQYFKLGSPPRLVVDLLGVQPEFKERTFPADDGFKQVRVGVTADKTRLVFDASGKVLPAFSVSSRAADLTVSWEMPKKAATMSMAPPEVAMKEPGSRRPGSEPSRQGRVRPLRRQGRAVPSFRRAFRAS